LILASEISRFLTRQNHGGDLLYHRYMAIMIRRHGGRWEKAEEVIYADEAQLQKMLYDSPELIPTKMNNQAAVFTKESGLPGSGFTDLIGVDGEGNILLVETKLAAK